MKISHLFAILLVGLVITFISCLGFQTIEEAGIKYDTVPSQTPSSFDWMTIGLAKELINIKSKLVVSSGGDNPVPASDWEDFIPRYPWNKNMDRFLLFDSTYFYKSPNVSLDCTTCKTQIDYKDHTWIELASIEGVAYIPKKTTIQKPEEGHLVIKTIKKCQLLLYKTGCTVYDLKDNQGNYYIMHATENGEPNLNVVLPKGWTLESRVLTEDFVLAPFGGGDFCYYNILGDHLGQGYHQYKYADATYPSE